MYSIKYKYIIYNRTWTTDSPFSQRSTNARITTRYSWNCVFISSFLLYRPTRHGWIILSVPKARNNPFEGFSCFFFLVSFFSFIHFDVLMFSFYVELLLLRNVSSVYFMWFLCRGFLFLYLCVLLECFIYGLHWQSISWCKWCIIDYFQSVIDKVLR